MEVIMHQRDKAELVTSVTTAVQLPGEHSAQFATPSQAETTSLGC